jgi:hypothetical protein
MTTRSILAVEVLSLAAAFTFYALPASAAGQLVNSWKTSNGWLTEMRVHPDGAKVCSTGKATQTPRAFGLTLVRSGSENLLLVVDETQPPTSAGDMTFIQGGKAVGTLRTQVAGPAFATTDPNSSQTPELVAKLTPAALTIDVAGRQYQTDMSGLPDALAQLAKCETQPK